MILLFKIDSI